MPESSTQLSVVITCFFEEQTIGEFHARLARALEGLGRSHEIIFVNDGSTDGTLARLEEIFERDPHVAVLVDLMRNSGQGAAITAGCAEARGRHIVLLDSDLQLDPEDLPRLVEEADKGIDVVSGVRVDRQDALGRRIASRLANVILRRVSRTTLRDFGCTFKVIDARLVRAFEPGPWRPLRPPDLFRQARSWADVPVAHHPRRHGRSGWSFGRLLEYAMDAVVGLSQRPFQILAALCFAVALLLVVRILVAPLLPRGILPEVTTGLILNVLVFSLLIVVGALCAVGEYVIRNYRALYASPAYVVRSVRRREGRAPGAGPA
jgi:glycosyltransferase involved in cell wall biosynthesis